MTGEVRLALPFQGRWLTRNSPARRIPSHGTNLMGSRYAIDFIGVDDRHRIADRTDWRTLFATEPVERFFAFGRPVLAPADGVVVRTHDGEVDHVARRSQLTLVPYALGQARRYRRGPAGLAGNHVVIALREPGRFVALAHLRAGSLRVAVGDEVTVGQHLVDCGNSGNSTSPHVHVQVMDDAEATVARGVPMTFLHFREWPGGRGSFGVRQSGLPQENAVVEPLPESPEDVAT
ncbi:MAG TPA: M23 family metallopeptidase [Actinopolymorphaceae bacterium]